MPIAVSNMRYLLTLTIASCFAMPVHAQSNVPPPAAAAVAPSTYSEHVVPAAKATADVLSGTSKFMSGMAFSVRNQLDPTAAAQLETTTKGIGSATRIVGGVQAVDTLMMRGDGGAVLSAVAAESLTQVAGGFCDAATVGLGRLASAGCKLSWSAGYAIGSAAEPVVDKWVEAQTGRSLTDQIYENVTRPLLGQPDMNDPDYWDKIKGDHRARLGARKAQNIEMAAATTAPLVYSDSGADSNVEGVNYAYILHLLQQARVAAQDSGDYGLSRQLDSVGSKIDSIKRGDNCPPGTWPGYLPDSQPRMGANGQWLKEGHSLHLVCSPGRRP